MRKINLERQRGEFLNIVTSWKRIRSLMLEVKRMNENYDALMISHLLKEMRTCETMFKQLNSELSAIAISTNESASTLCHLSYKILHLTWKCLHARATNQLDSLELIDERWQQRVKDFTTIESTTVRQLLVNDNLREHLQGKTKAKTGSTSSVTQHMAVIPEKEVLTRTDAIRSVLLVYAKDLHDIFKHYSASTGAGSIASLSVSEFNKFIKVIVRLFSRERELWQPHTFFLFPLSPVRIVILTTRKSRLP
jgi:hypothetical protein